MSNSSRVRSPVVGPIKVGIHRPAPHPLSRATSTEGAQERRNDGTAGAREGFKDGGKPMGTVGMGL